MSFAGSIIAFLKLQELMTGRPITYPAQQVVNALVLLVILVSWALVVAGVEPVLQWFWIALIASLILGVLFVLPIGGADMPVVISLLNSFTGLAAASTGFVLGNNVLIIAGALVGASGTLLTLLMGKAMNRSITNVLFGAFGAVKTSTAGAGAKGGQNVRSVSADDVATMLAYANEVIVVPGYGMAVAQAQHSVRELADQLEKRGVEVKYAIHPVAGRMPGHMNVLLAEANVPYTPLYDMDDINPEFERADVALVVGANDVTNPAAREDKTARSTGCRSSTSTKRPTSSCSSARWPRASPGSTTRSTTTPRRRCSSATPKVDRRRDRRREGFAGATLPPPRRTRPAPEPGRSR